MEKINPEWKAKYAGQWVYVKEGKVLFANSDMYDLCKEVEKAGYPAYGSDIKYIEK